MTKRFDQLVELYLGPVTGWVDITADVRGTISITRGDSEGRPTPGKCTFRLDNLSGDYSWRNPAGQWYGLLGPNSPLRVSAGPTGGTLAGRFHGEIVRMPGRHTTEGNDRWVDVEAAGILRRTGQGEQPSWSALRRTIDGSDPLAYWPLEDGSDTGQGGSAVSGVPALTITGSAPFADIASWTTSQGYTVVYGTSALTDIADGGRFDASVPASVITATAAGWTVGVCSDVTVGVSLSADLVLVEVATPGGTHARWQLVITTTGRTQLIAYTAAGTATTVIDYASVLTSMIPHNVAVWQSGGTIQAGYLWAGGTYFATGSVAGTLAGVGRVSVNPTATTATVAMPTGHLAVWAGHDLAVTNYYDGDIMLALFGYAWSGLGTAGAAPTGEAADVRLARVWAEQGVTVTAAGVETSPVMLGRQPTAKLADLTEQCTDADGGYLFESRDALELAYRPRSTLYNQTPTPIAYVGQLAPPFEPVDDADDVRNDVTVKRTDGSSARVVETSGRLAAVVPPDGVGVYRTQVELNVADDGRLLDLASWRVHLGTVDRPRYSSLSVQLAGPEWQAAPAALAALLAVDIGDVLEVTGLPVWAAGDVRTLVTGYTEKVDEYTWSITFAGVPAQPWDVGEVDGEARVAMDGGTLAAAVTAGGLTLSLASTPSGGLWTTNSLDFPLDLRVGEERVTVSAISGAASPQTATVSARAVNGVAAAWPAGTDVDVWLPAVVAL